MLASEEVFQDYTVATSLERFISSIEEIVSSWVSADVEELSAQQALQGISSPPGCVEVQASVQHHLSFRNEAYILTLHADRADASVCSTRPKHDRQSRQQGALPGLSDLAGPQQSPSLAHEHAQTNPGRLSSPQRRRPAHQQSAEGHSEDSRAAAGQNERQHGAQMVGRHEGWPGICPGAVLNGHHKVQTWMGVSTFLSLEPASYSRRILNDQEAGTLQSALCAALSSTSCPWPAVIPVHDPLRDACWGVAVTRSGTTAFLDSDSIHISNLPEKLLQVEGLLGLFGQRLGPHAPQAAAAVAAVASDMSLGSMASSAAGQPPAAYARNVTLSERRTYRVPPPVALDEGSGNESSSELEWRQEWDADSAWRPWAVHPDPVGRLELDIVWDQVPASSAVQQEPLNPGSASAWRVHVIDPAHAQTYGHSAFSLHSQEPKRVRLRIAHEPLQPDRWADRDTTFAGMLQNLLDSAAAASEAKSMGQLTAAEWWELRGTQAPEAPPESTLQDVLRDLVEAPALPSAFNAGFPSRAAGPAAENESRLESCEGTAPPGALASRLALHALAFPNARAVAALWCRMVRELRFARWETGAPLPRMRAQRVARSEGPNSHWQASVLAEMTGGMPDAPDLGACILHQKLQMLNCCIFLIRHPDAAFISLSLPCTGAASNVDAGSGLAGQVQGTGQFLLLHMPQLVTSDMLAEREAALAAAGPAGEAAKARLQAPLLRQCMQAFRAMLPEAQLGMFRGFLRQHWGALGLSSHSINSHQLEALWEETQAATAEQQRPLWSVELEGERALHYFETLPPEAACAQLLRLGLSSALHLLACAEGATCPPAKSALDRCGTQLQALCAKEAASREDSVKVVETLRWAERIVVTGEALTQRLLGRRQLVQRLLESCIDETRSSHTGHIPARGASSSASEPSTADDQMTEDGSKSLEGEKGREQAHEPTSAAPPEHPGAYEQQQKILMQSRQPCSSSDVDAGTSLNDRADVAFICCLLDRQQQNDIQTVAEALEGTLRAGGQREISTVDWDQPLQSTRVLDCESTENQLVQGEPTSAAKGGPKLGHRLFARWRPGELRLGTVLLSEQ